MLFSVKPFQYRGKVWIGVDVSFSSFLCAREKDRFAGETCMFLQLFQKKFRQVCHSQTTPFRIVVTLYPITRESGSDLSPGTN